MREQSVRISLSGTFSTGKTTLAEALAPQLTHRLGSDFHYIPEVARTVIARGFVLDRAATIDAYNVYIQLQLKAERDAADARCVLSDRSLIDLLAYIRFNDHDAVPSYVREMLEEIVWLESRFFDRFAYLPIAFPLEDDGVRTPDETYRRDIDRTIQSVLSEYGVAVETVSGSLEERVAQLGLFFTP